jgi:hypothetical protein
MLGRGRQVVADISAQDLRHQSWNSPWQQVHFRSRGQVGETEGQRIPTDKFCNLNSLKTGEYVGIGLMLNRMNWTNTATSY